MIDMSDLKGDGDLSLIIMSRVFHGMMDGLSLHYYTLPEVEDDWNKKGSATDFTEEIFYQTLKRGYFMDELINRHGAIMMSTIRQEDRSDR